MKLSTVATGAALFAGASAGPNYLGFNSGSTLPDQSAKFQADFEAEFTTAQNLVGAPGTFNAVRLYTSIQAYTQQDPIQAFQAAINTKTYILLGIWTSGTNSIDTELNALSTAVKQYGTAFTDLVIGISIGSEDLYRDGVTGQANKAGVGAGPQTIIGFINAYEKAFANTPLAKIPKGHVDTWDAWANTTNKAVIDAVDWLGADEYSFYETGKNNDIQNAGSLFDQAYNATLAVANGKPIWITETGWPINGPNWDQAVPSVANAKTYWDEVGCRRLFNKVPTFWYNLRDSNPDNQVKFGISENLSTTPEFNLTCPTAFDTSDGGSGSSSAKISSTATTIVKKGSATQTALVTAPLSSGSGSPVSKGNPSKTTSGHATSVTNAGAMNRFSGAAYAGVVLIAGLVAI